MFGVGFSLSVAVVVAKPCLPSSSSSQFACVFAMSDNRGLLAPGSQQDPPGGEPTALGYPQAVAVEAPPAGAPGPAPYAYAAPQGSPMENVHVGAPAAGKAGAPPPVQQPYGQPPPHQQQQQPYGHPQQPYGHPQQHQQQQQVYGQPSASGAPPQQPYGQAATPTKPPPQVGGARAYERQRWPFLSHRASQVVVSPPYRDVVFAGLFVVHLFVILVLAFALGVPALSRADDNTTSKVDVSDTHPIIGLLVVAGIVGAVLSSLWVMFLQRNARTIVTCTLWTSVILELACAVVVMFISPGAGVIFLFLAAITLWYVFIAL